MTNGLFEVVRTRVLTPATRLHTHMTHMHKTYSHARHTHTYKYTHMHTHMYMHTLAHVRAHTQAYMFTWHAPAHPRTRTLMHPVPPRPALLSM